MTLLRVEAERVAHSKKWVWLRIWDGTAYKILTMPRDFLPWGMASATKVVLEYKDGSLHHNGHGFVVDGKITEQVDGQGTMDTPQGAS